MYFLYMFFNFSISINESNVIEGVTKSFIPMSIYECINSKTRSNKMCNREITENYIHRSHDYNRKMFSTCCDPSIDIDTTGILVNRKRSLYFTDKVVDPYHIGVTLYNNPFKDETLNLIPDIKGMENYRVSSFHDMIGLINMNSKLYEVDDTDIEILKGHNIKNIHNKNKVIRNKYNEHNKYARDENYIENIKKQEQDLFDLSFEEGYKKISNKEEMKNTDDNLNFEFKTPKMREVDENLLQNIIENPKNDDIFGNNQEKETKNNQENNEFSKHLLEASNKSLAELQDLNQNPNFEIKTSHENENLINLWDYKVQNPNKRYYYAIKVNNKYICPSKKSMNIIECPYTKTEDADIFVWILNKENDVYSLKHKNTGNCVRLVKHDFTKTAKKNILSDFYKLEMGKCETKFKIELAPLMKRITVDRYSKNIMKNYENELINKSSLKNNQKRERAFSIIYQ